MSGDIGPGDFVECVDAAAPPGTMWRAGEAPILGAIYRVESVFHNQWTGRDNFTLSDLRRRNDTPGRYRGYAVQRFRPIYRPRESLIRDLLEPVGVGA